jgi:hypothetical protein
LGERNFRDIVMSVKAAFSGLLEMEAAIRRITGASPAQSAQEAVEQLVLARQ